MRRSRFLIGTLGVLAATRAATAAEGGTIVVMAPLNSDKSLGDVIKDFQAKHPGTTVRTFFGRADVVYGQLEAGAACDVFVSSIPELSAKATQKGLVEAWRPLAKLVPTIMVAKNNPQHVTGLRDLANKGVKISMGADETPIGRYTHALLKRAVKDYGADFPERFMANVTSRGVNTKGVTGQINNGTADAGIVFKSDLIGDELQRATEIAIAPDLAGVIQNEIAVTKASSNKQLAKAFADYAVSPEGQAVFHRYRFE